MKNMEALNNSSFRVYWLGQVVSLLGSWMQHTAIYWILISLFEKNTNMSIYFLLSYLPMIIFTLYGGKLADQFDRRKILVITQLGLSGIAVCYAILLTTNLLTIPTIFVLAFISGALLAIDMPTQSALIANIVSKEQLSSAISLNLMGLHSARLISPAIAGILMLHIELKSIFIIDACSFIIVIVSLLLININWTQVDKSELKTNISIKQLIRDTPYLQLLLSLNFICSFFILSFILVFIGRISQVMIDGAELELGIAMSCTGVGALIGASIANFIKPDNRHKVMLFSFFYASLFIFILAINTDKILFMINMLAIAMFVSIGQALRTIILQECLDDEIRGRILSINFLLFTISIPLAAVMFGLLADIIGLKYVFILAAISFNLCLLLLVRKLGSHKHRESVYLT